VWSCSLAALRGNRHGAQMIEPGIYAALTATAVFTGFIDAIAGGGGLVMMPALLFAGLPPHLALGTNKVQSMCGTAIATYRYRRAGLFRIGPNKPVIAAVFAGALAGAVVIQWIGARVLALIVPVLLMAVALYTVVSPRMDDSDSHERLGHRGYLPVGGAIGFYDGFLRPRHGTVLCGHAGRPARNGADAGDRAHQTAQRHQQPGQRDRLRHRRQDHLAAGNKHGIGRDDRRLARRPFRRAARGPPDPAAPDHGEPRADGQADLGLVRGLAARSADWP